MKSARKSHGARKLSLEISDALLEYHLGLDETWDRESGPDIPKDVVHEPEFSHEIKALVELGCKKVVLFWCLDYCLKPANFTVPDRKEFRSLIHTFAKASKQIKKYSLEIATIATAGNTAPPDWNIWDGARRRGGESDFPAYEELPLPWRCDHALARLPDFLNWCSTVAKKWETPNVRPARNGALPLSVYLELVLSRQKSRGRAGASHDRVAALLGCTHVPQPQEDTIKKNLYNFRQRSPRLYRLLRRALSQYHATAKE